MYVGFMFQAQKNLGSGDKKAIYKTVLAGGAQVDLERVAKEQQIKNQQEIEKILKAVKAKHSAGKTKDKLSIHNGTDLKENERKEKKLCKTSVYDAVSNLDDLESEIEEGEQMGEGGIKNKRHAKIRVGFSKATGKLFTHISR